MLTSSSWQQSMGHDISRNLPSAYALSFARKAGAGDLELRNVKLWQAGKDESFHWEIQLPGSQVVKWDTYLWLDPAEYTSRTWELRGGYVKYEMNFHSPWCGLSSKRFQYTALIRNHGNREHYDLHALPDNHEFWKLRKPYETIMKAKSCIEALKNSLQDFCQSFCTTLKPGKTTAVAVVVTTDAIGNAPSPLTAKDVQVVTLQKAQNAVTALRAVQGVFDNCMGKGTPQILVQPSQISHFINVGGWLAPSVNSNGQPVPIGKLAPCVTPALAVVKFAGQALAVFGGVVGFFSFFDSFQQKPASNGITLDQVKQAVHDVSVEIQGDSEVKLMLQKVNLVKSDFDAAQWFTSNVSEFQKRMQSIESECNIGRSYVDTYVLDGKKGSLAFFRPFAYALLSTFYICALAWLAKCHLTASANYASFLAAEKTKAKQRTLQLIADAQDAFNDWCRQHFLSAGFDAAEVKKSCFANNPANDYVQDFKAALNQLENAWSQL